MEFERSGKLLQACGARRSGEVQGRRRLHLAGKRARHLRRPQRFRLHRRQQRQRQSERFAWGSTNGTDGMILKFTKQGKFVMMIGGPHEGPDSNNMDGGKNVHTAVLPAGGHHRRSDDQPHVCVRRLRQSPRDHRRCCDRQVHRPLRRLWQQPGRRHGCGRGRTVDERLHEGQHEAGVFPQSGALREDRKEGLIYVCDRGNNRMQVFNGRDPNLGKECANTSGDAGKCGFVKEQQVAIKTNGLPGSAVSMNFRPIPNRPVSTSATTPT